MADFTLTSGRFPNGTSVGAYTASAAREGAAPEGAAITSATMTNGTLTFTGLANDALFVAYALVSSEHRYVRFSTLRALQGGNVRYSGQVAATSLRIESADGSTDVIEATPTTLGFYNATPVARAAAIAGLTMTVGTADGTVADVGAAFNQATLNNNFRDIGEKVNSALTVLRNLGLIAP